MARGKRKGRRIILGSIGALLLVLFAAVVAAAILIDDSDIARYLESRVEKATGRPFRIGNLDIDWGLPTRLVATDVRLANPPWAEHPMLRVERVAGNIGILPLLGGNVVLDDVRIGNGVLRLIRSEEGRVNWDFHGEAEAPGRADFPVIAGARLNDFVIDYRDRTKGSDRTLVLAEARLSTNDDTTVEALGSLDGLPLHAETRGGTLPICGIRAGASRSRANWLSTKRG